jgi:hypothetical protein
MKDGLSPSCKACKAEQSRIYRSNPDVKARDAVRLQKYYAENKQKIDEKRSYYLQNPEVKKKQKIYQKRYRSKPEAAAKIKERTSKYRSQQENRDRKKDQRLRSKYGITLEQYNQMHAAQNHSCDICKKHQDNFKSSLHVDHNHKTGNVRGLLCFRCNRLYVAQHTIETALAVYQYLLRHDGKKIV